MNEKSNSRSYSQEKKNKNKGDLLGAKFNTAFIVTKEMIACMPTTQKNELDISKMEFIEKCTNQSSEEEEKINIQDNDKENTKNIQTSPKLVSLQQQKQTEKRTFPYFRYDDKKRLNQIRGIISSAQKGKPIRLYLENIPSFANEFDFQDRCPGLLNVVWNHKRPNSCFILVENKEYALDILDIESEIPPYCKEGRVFVTRVEENSILYAKKPNPKRFESYFNLSDDSGFFIVESNKMKYYWYDQKGGFYDEFGIYYNKLGRPSPPPYINTNNRDRANRSRKNNRQSNENNNNHVEKNSNHIEKNNLNGDKNNHNKNEKNNNNNYLNEKNNNNQKNASHQEQKQNQSPKLNSQRYQSNTQVEYIKKSVLEQIETLKQSQSEDSVLDNNKQQQQFNSNENQKQNEVQKKNQKKNRK